MKAIALDSLNQIVDNGARRTKDGWFRWANRRNKFTQGELKAGFKIHVSFFDNERGQYFRITGAGMPVNRWS